MKSYYNQLVAFLALFVVFFITPSALAKIVKAPNDILIGHKAAYEFSLKKRKSSSDIVGVQGIMSMRTDISCDTVATRQTLLLDYETSQSGVMRYEESSQTVENLENGLFSFINSVKVNGNITKSVKGSARNNGTGSAEVKRTDASGEQVVLTSSKALEFPAMQMNHVLQAFSKGETRYQSRFFDSSNGAETFYDVIVTKETGNGVNIRPDYVTLSDWEKGHQLQFTFFEAQEGDIFSPESVMTSVINDQGVTYAIQVDFEDYSLSAQLISLEKFSKIQCDK